MWIMILSCCLCVLVAQIVYDRVTRQDARREWEETHDGLRWEDWH
jgi:hypothetical protein